MIRRLSAILLFTIMLMIGGLAVPAPSSKIPARTSQSVLRLQLPNGETFCSSFVIDQQRRFLMTADHCLRRNPPMIVRGKFAREVFHVEHYDAAVVQVEMGDALPPALSPDVVPLVLEQATASFGYADGKDLRRTNMFVVFPVIMFPGADGSFVVLSPTLIGGMSGGPIVSERGVVGINMAGRDDPDLAVMRPIGPIYELTKDYWQPK